MQELGDDQVRDLVVDRRAEKDDPLIEQTAVDVERALPTGGLLDDHGYEWAHRPRFVGSERRNRAFASCAGILPTVATGGHPSDAAVLDM